MLEMNEPVAPPALLAARLSAVPRLLQGRKVDVVAAPKLMRLPIHLAMALSQPRPASIV